VDTTVRRAAGLGLPVEFGCQDAHLQRMIKSMPRADRPLLIIMRLCRIYRALALNRASHGGRTSISLGLITLTLFFLKQSESARYTFFIQSFIHFLVGFMYQDVLDFLV